jgi:hypothetical protein
VKVSVARAWLELALKREVRQPFSPPEGVRLEAKRALRWIEDGHAGSGFTAVGRRRAQQLADGDPVSLDVIRRMASYLARHEVDKDGEGWSPGEPGYPSPGRVAWAAWGGDPAVSWTRSILENAQEGRNPWRIVIGYAACPTSEPFAVLSMDGTLEGCHSSSADAQAQIAALYLNVEDVQADNLRPAG